ncbi:hypothetical protein PDJAM_G00205990 [Pangasius djambal]|uniref:Uncharacterized protein n=1 Tax=Pangasius djambal TaxID=1691987 RepID=A0ACC5Y8Q5_9TELE|nr:hypothetical protein [Pangasius djambal]
MARWVRANRTATETHITTLYNRKASQNAHHVETLRRMGYNSRRSCRVPLLSAENRKLRLQCAQAHQNWTAEDWRNIAWSVESGFLLRLTDGRERIVRIVSSVCRYAGYGGQSSQSYSQPGYGGYGPGSELDSSPDLTVRDTAPTTARFSNVVVDEVTVRGRCHRKEGTKVTFPREGDESPGCITADIVFVIKDKPHSHFRREGSDIVYPVRISLHQVGIPGPNALVCLQLP